MVLKEFDTLIHLAREGLSSLSCPRMLMKISYGRVGGDGRGGLAGSEGREGGFGLRKFGGLCIALLFLVTCHQLHIT